MSTATVQKQALMVAEVSREDAASRSLLARDPAIWFFLNLLMSNIGKTNEHLEHLHEELREAVQKLESINQNTEAMIYGLGK